MDNKFFFKHFSELTTFEMYKILQLRQDVFIIEQQCIYPDLDNVDLNCFHLVMKNENELIGYCRIIEPGIKYESSSIGRVIIKPEYRGKKLGIPLMTEAIKLCKLHWGKYDVSISAQAHLQKFYSSLGFICKGEIYNEDGIPHVKMQLALR
jgi:ElaA protein